ncbi:MAG: HAD family hydrolase [Micromonosporaceae bacterium]
MGPVEAVLFDLDDTLLDGDAAWRCGMNRMLARCPEVDRTAAFQAWDVVTREHYPRYLAGELTFEESRVARVRSWADRVGVTVEANAELAWFHDYRAGYEAGWVAFGDVGPCLKELERLRLGVITNGDGAQQRAKLAALGFEAVFEVVIASGDIGCAKPDPRIFHFAAARLGLPPERCLFVGDQRDSDALGALAAGMPALWLNRDARTAPDDQVPEIATLAELPVLVRGTGGHLGEAHADAMP